VTDDACAAFSNPTLVRNKADVSSHARRGWCGSSRRGPHRPGRRCAIAAPRCTGGPRAFAGQLRPHLASHTRRSCRHGSAGSAPAAGRRAPCVDTPGASWRRSRCWKRSDTHARSGSLTQPVTRSCSSPPRPAAAPARRLLRRLQHPPAAPVAAPPCDAGHDLHRPPQNSSRRRPPQRHPLARPPRHHQQYRKRHPARRRPTAPSASAEPTPEPTSCCSSKTSTSASSTPPPANSYAN